MTLEEVQRFYGSAKECAKQLGIAKNTPLHWKNLGYVPMLRQIQIEKLTDGALKATMDDARVKQGF